MNSLKTILSRLTTLPKAEKALNGIGISIKNQNGDVKSASDILSELAGKWNTLSAEEQQHTAISVAGTYQLTRFLALMQNWQIALNATTTAQNSSGSAMSENEKYMESLQARIQQMKTAWDTLTISLGNTVISDSIKVLTGLFTTMSNVVNASINSIGGLPTMFGLIAAAIYMTVPAFRGFIANTYASAAGLVSWSVTAGIGTASTIALSAALRAAKGALIGLLATTGVGLAFVALGFVVEKVIGLFDTANEKMDDTASIMDKLKESSGNLQELRSLSKEYEELGQKTKLTAEEKNRLAIIEQNLSSKQGIVLSSTQDQTQAFKENSAAIQQQIQLLEAQTEAQRKQAEIEYRNDSASISSDIQNQKANIEEFKKGYEEAKAELLDFTEKANSGELIASGKWSEKTIARALARLAKEEEDARENLEKETTLLQQSTNKRAAALQGDFERQVQIIEQGGTKINDTTKQYIANYAEIAAQSNRTDLSITQGFENFVKELNNQNFSDKDSTIEYFQKSFPELQLASGSLSGALQRLQNTFAQINSQPAVDENTETGDSAEDASEKILTLKDSIDALEQGINGNGDSMNQFAKFVSDVKDEVSLLNDAQKELKDENNLSASTIEKMNEKYGDFITVTGLSRDKVLEFIKAKKNEKTTFFNTEIEKTKILISETEKRIKAYQIELEAINKVNQARAKQIQQSLVNDVQSGAISDLEAEKRIANARTGGTAGEQNKLNTSLAEQNVILTDATKKLQILQGVQSNVISQDKQETKSKEEKEKKQKEYNDTISETNEILTETLKRLKEIDAAIEKLEGRRKRLKVGTDEYNASLAKQQQLIREQIKIRENAKPEDLLPIKTTTTQKVAQGSTADGGAISNVDLTSSSNGIGNLVSNARNLQGNFVYKQVAGEFKGTYDQFVKQGISDCSQFVQEMYKQFLDTKLPRTAAQQAKQGTAVDRKDLQAGDLVFWNTTGKSNSHVGVYTANGKAIQMGNHGLKEIPIDTIPNYEGARRIVSGGANANVPSISTKGNNTTTTKSADGKTTVKVDRPTSQELLDIKASNESELVKLYNDLYDNQVEMVQSIVKKSEDAYNKIDVNISASERKQSTFSVDTPEYRKEAEKQSSLLEQQQKNLQDRNKAIRDYIKKNNIVSGVFDDELASNSAKWLELQQQRMGKAQEITDSYLTSYKNKLDDVSHSLDMSNAKMALMDEGTNAYNQEMASQIPLLEKQKDLYAKQAEFIDGQLNNQKIEKAYRDQLLKDREQLSVEWYKTAEAIKQINDTLRKLQEERVDTIIEDMKSAIDKQKDLALNAIDAEKEAEDERHNKRVKNIENESNQFKKYIQDRINAYQRENATTDYESDLKKAIKERDKIQAQIDEISLNNSASADKKRRDLKEQLASANENITKLQTDREREMTVQGLNDQLDSYNEYTDKAKENEDQSYDQFVKNIDSRKKKTEQTYNDMLNDEKKYYNLKQNLMSSDKTVVNSTIEEIKGFYSGLFSFMNDASFETSKSFENMSYTIQQALEKVNKYSMGDYSQTPTVDNKTTPATDLNKQTQTQNTSQAWSQYLNNKKQAELIQQKKNKLNVNSKEYKDLDAQFNSLKSANDKLRNQYGFADLAYNILSKATAPVINGSARYNTGGGTGNWAGNDPKIAFVDKEETILNTPSTKNMVTSLGMIDDITKNAAQLIKSATSSNDITTTGDTHIHVNIPNLTTVKDGTDLGNKLFTSLDGRGVFNKVVRG